MLLAKLYESHYRARWKGIILNPTRGDCFYCLVLFDRHGNAIKQKIVKCLHKHWIVDTGKMIDISHVNPDWLALVRGEA